MNLKDYAKTIGDLGATNKGVPLQLTTLMAFYDIYGGDLNQIDDLNDGIANDLGRGIPVLGVFLSTAYEEDTVVVYTYYEPSSGFSIQEVEKRVKDAATFVSNVVVGRFTIGNSNAETLLQEYLSKDDEDNVRPVLIKVLTLSDLPEVEAYDAKGKIGSMNLSSRSVHVEAELDFGVDIAKTIESNLAPYENVPAGELRLDRPNNVLRFEDKSFVCNVSAKSLKDLWDKEGNKGLLAMNLRYYIKNASIDGNVERSIRNNPGDFWYFNNGIIIVCDSAALEGDVLRLKNFSVVNGGQTTRMIGTTPIGQDFYVLAKIVINRFEDQEKKALFVSQVAEYSNTQKPIKAKDLIANRPEQRLLKSALLKEGVFLEIKRGEKPIGSFSEPWQKMKNQELAQILYAFVFLHPGPARNNVSKMLQNEQKYELIFRKHEYSFPFLKSLLFLFKALKSYKRKAGKDEEADATSRGLAKNGVFYALATIGYLLKRRYCPAFADNCRKSGSNASFYKEATEEQAFDFGFLPPLYENNFKLFLKDSFRFFDYLFGTLIRPTFESQKEDNASTTPANWTKSDTGFTKIERQIETNIASLGETFFDQKLFGLFLAPNDKMREPADDLYRNLREGNKVFKTSRGTPMSEDDGQLRNALLVFREDYATKKHIAPNRVFTEAVLNKLVAEKPVTSDQVRSILPPTSYFYVGPQIVKIIQDFLQGPLLEEK